MHKRRPPPVKASAAAILVWLWPSRKVGACAMMGRVQGGARAAFATLSWGPSRMFFIPQNLFPTANYKKPASSKLEY